MNEIAQLYSVADDEQAAVLDELRLKAGQAWLCRNRNGRVCWMNDSSDNECAICHSAKVAIDDYDPHDDECPECGEPFETAIDLGGGDMECAECGTVLDGVYDDD